jgi:predicted ATP-dependent serine protease
MKLINTANADFIKAEDVVIPDSYYNRFKTGVETLDFCYGGDGFLPGMSFTFAAPPGSGKTTFLLQTLNLLEKNNKNTAYVSGEETVEQLAFTCKRIGVNQVRVANITCIEDIFDAVQKNKFSMLVIDSFPSMTSRDETLHGIRLEKYLSDYICTKSKELECVVGIILHYTKNGSYKGSTLLPHSVDANFTMEKDAEDETLRIVEATKNRFGTCAHVAFRMTDTGFSFEKVERDEIISGGKKTKKSDQYKASLIKAVTDSGKINLATATELLGDISKAMQTLRELTLVGKLKKEGKGGDATYTLA